MLLIIRHCFFSQSEAISCVKTVAGYLTGMAPLIGGHPFGFIISSGLARVLTEPKR
jgi:hypothetical protein